MARPLYILGAGISGVAAARLAAAEGRGGELISERPPESCVLEELDSMGFGWRQDFPESFDGEVILSPGIPKSHRWMDSLREQGVVGVPEFEWAASRLKGVQIAVTGSLGKTSMVLLAAELLRDAGYRVTVSGNIAPAVSEVALTNPVADFHVIELSSFQLENLRHYRPDRALCLNLFPNHLDRHSSMKEYGDAKALLFKNQRPGDLAVWPRDFPCEVSGAGRRSEMDSIPLPDLEGTSFVSGALRKNLQSLFTLLDEIPGVDAFQQVGILQTFQFPPHRMQHVEIPGAGKVIDDSKSTCLRATMAALEAVEGEIQLVMGGLEKGESFEEMLPLFRERNPQLYLFGRASKKMCGAWQDSVDVCRTFDTLDFLLPVLWESRTDAQTLLFSPGCASFDQFEGYAARGQHFQGLVSIQAIHFPLY